MTCVEILMEQNALSRDQMTQEQSQIAIAHLTAQQVLEASHLNDRQAMEKDQRIPDIIPERIYFDFARFTTTRY